MRRHASRQWPSMTLLAAALLLACVPLAHANDGASGGAQDAVPSGTPPQQAQAHQY